MPTTLRPENYSSSADNSSKPEELRSTQSIIHTNDEPLDPGYRTSKPVDTQLKKKRLSPGKIVSLVLISISIFILGAGAYFGYNVLALNNDVFGQGSDVGFWGQLGRLAGNITNRRQPIKGEEEGRTNVLLLGRDSNGPGLTDSIMIGSYYHEEDKFITVNIPRDFYVFDGFGQMKINSVYSFAESRQPGSGEDHLAEFLGDEFGIEIHYWASISFEGLERLVDELGGIEVDVERSFTDCQYPDRAMVGYIRPCPSFEAGRQTLNGEQALIYARSRMGTNGEGSDFARSRRQSIVIQAITQKAIDSGVILNASKVTSYLDILGGAMRTNARIDEIISASGLRNEFDPSSDFLRMNWDNTTDFLCDGSSAEGLYVITYCGGAIAGYESNNRSRLEAQSIMQNLLNRSELSALYDANVQMYGNLSLETEKAFNEFSFAGFKNITYNNNYTQIAPATFNSVEKVNIYIEDENLRNLFNRLEPKPDIDYELFETTPETKILPNNADNADVIVWVESI
jgi:LCP family protein required for cell wall assembly